MQKFDDTNKSHLRWLHLSCRLLGIQPSYYTPQNQVIWSTPQGLLHGLEVLTHQKISTVEDLKEICHQHKLKKYQRGLSASLSLWQNEKKFLDVYLMSSEVTKPIIFKSDLHWSLTIPPETLISFKVKKRPNCWHYKIPLEKIPLGYHKVQMTTSERKISSFWISAPQKLTPQDRKTWGIFAPLYALRSETDWGIGSFKELKTLSQVVQKQAAQWVGTLPLLACDYSKPENDPSPYSSLTRLFWNEIYLDVDSLIKASHKLKNFWISNLDLQKELETLRSTALVNYYRVYQIKAQVLKLLAQEFFETQQDQTPEFKNFVQQNSELYDYARFRALTPEDEKYHVYVQFQMDQQLSQFKNSKEFLGLYLDYPVGVSEAGFDFFKNPSVFISEFQAGAPPEPFYPEGQNWGFPPLNFNNLAQAEFQYFRKTLNSHMRYTQMLRIDHIMGFYRIYVTPKGLSGTDGFYMRYGQEELFAMAVLEASQNQVTLIGENLGTVPKAVNKILNQRQIYGMWVFYTDFEQSPEQSLKTIHPLQLIGVNTHDMAPWAAFLKNLPKNSKGLERWVQILKEKYPSTLDSNPHDPNRLYKALLKLFTALPAQYLVFNPEDCWLEILPQNQPGHATPENWRKKFKEPLQNWEQNSYVTDSLEILKKAYSEKN